MSGEIEIGWCTKKVENYFFDYRRRESLKTFYGEFDQKPQFFYCPPVVDFLKNTYGYYSASKVNVFHENGKLHVLQGHQHAFLAEENGEPNYRQLIIDEDHSLEYRFPDEIFISDTPGVKIQLMPHPKSKYQNIVCAELDIYKWFRSFHCPYYFNGDQFHLMLDEDEPLFIIKFITPNDETVKLVELDYSKIEKYADQRRRMRILTGENIRSYKWWKNTFDVFANKRPKNMIDYARIDK